MVHVPNNNENPMLQGGAPPGPTFYPPPGASFGEMAQHILTHWNDELSDKWREGAFRHLVNAAERSASRAAWDFVWNQGSHEACRAKLRMTWEAAYLARDLLIWSTGGRSICSSDPEDSHVGFGDTDEYVARALCATLVETCDDYRTRGRFQGYDVRRLLGELQRRLVRLARCLAEAGGGRQSMAARELLHIGTHAWLAGELVTSRSCKGRSEPTRTEQACRAAVVHHIVRTS